MHGSMDILAETARKYGGVDPNNHEAVAEFLEQNADRIPREEIDQIISVLIQRNAAPTPHVLPDAKSLPQPDLQDFPSADDARREATFYEQLQQVRANDYHQTSDTEYRRHALGRLFSRVAVSLILGIILFVIPDGFSATSAAGRMTQIALAVASTMSVLLAIDYFLLPFMSVTRGLRRTSSRPGRAARQTPP